MKIPIALIGFLLTAGMALADDPGNPDSVYIGNLDGSPIIAGLDEEISVPVWIKTDDSVGIIHLPLATHDSVIMERTGGEHVIRNCILCFPPGYPAPDFFEFPTPDSMNTHWTNQSLFAWWPPDELLNTQYNWCHKFNFLIRTSSDPALIGDTVFCLTEGDSPVNGGPFFGLADGMTMLVPAILYGSLYFVQTDVKDMPPTPRESALLDIFPNPFNASTTVEFTLPEEAHVELSIYNILGQKVSVLFDGRKNAGKYSVTWDAGGMPSGVYFARLESREKSKSIKMIILK